MAAEALILSMIQKLQRRQARISCFRFCMFIPCIFGSDREKEVESIIMEEKKVIDELRTIVDILKDKKLEEGSRVDYLISDLLEMAHDALDLYQLEKTDTFSYEIESIQSWIGEMKTCLLKFEGDGREPESDMRSRNAGEGDHKGEEVVGMEEDVKLLLHAGILNEDRRLMDSSTIAPIHVDNRLNEEKRRPWTSLITGVAGIGKTTLARQVYNHAAVVARFEHRAWVCFSTESTHKEVLMKLLKQVIDCEEREKHLLLEKMERSDNRTLRLMLHRCMQGKRYLIVFDDLPKQIALSRSILRCLPDEDIGSRLLLISRTEHTQKISHSHNYNYSHEMQPLNFEDSWHLFLRTVFNGTKSSSGHQSQEAHLEKYGKDLLSTQCGGVPSAIKEVAMKLAEMRRSGSDEWEQLLQQMYPDSVLEALISQIIRKLNRLPYREQSKLEGVSKDLKMMADFVRVKKLGGQSNLYYCICDVVDMFQDLIDKKRYNSNSYVGTVKNWLINVRRRIRDFRVDGPETEAIIMSETFGGHNDDDKEVMGLDKDVKTLLRKAGQENPRLLTVLITGMVGIGKTTLATQLYNHADVIKRFKRRAWVCVSSDSSHKQVLMEIMQQVVHDEEFDKESLLDKMKLPDNCGLRKMLHEQLRGKRYFIVLDNFPKEMCLEYITEALPHEGEGSLLLLTSRSTRITCSKGCIDYTHRMKTLNPIESWKLLSKTISSELRIPKDLEEKARKMLRKCGGVPLAIIEVGKQLVRMRPSGSEGEKIPDSVNFDKILALFESSYHDLDPNSMACFFYMAFFKEDATIRAKKFETILGIVKGLSVNQINSSIRILDEQSIIEIKDRKSFRINAVLHMMSIKKAGGSIGCEILSNDKGNNRPSQTINHRVISCSRDEFNYSTNQDKNLVSLFFHGGGYFDASSSYWKRFEKLKVLDWEDFGLKILPDIGTLPELKYLGLRNNYIQQLPESLGCLKKLEFLDIALNYMVELPDTISKMRSIRQLYMSDVICRRPLKIDALKKLEILTYISVDNWTYELSGLPMMICLHKLGLEEVDGTSNVRKLFASLAKLEALEHLILRGFRFRSMPCLNELRVIQNLKILKLEGRLASLPSANDLPRHIESLTLVNSCLDEDPMLVLGKVHNLHNLKLRNAYTGKKMVILQKSFPMLRELHIEELWNMKSIDIRKGSMSRLVKLEINRCPYLETLPEGIRAMSSLEELRVVTTKSIATKIRNLDLISKIKVVDINP